MSVLGDLARGGRMEIIKILRRASELVTYKPGCSFSVEEQDDKIAIVMSRMAPDTRMPTEIATIRFTRIIDENEVNAGEKDFAERLFYNVIRDAEMHEVDEWFRFRGVCVHDPHPENVATVD